MAAGWCSVPGTRRADAFDMFLAGREATVAAVFHDVDSGRHLAVTIDDDPGADLKDGARALPVLRSRRGRAAAVRAEVEHDREPRGSWSPVSATSSGPTTAFGVEVARRLAGVDLPEGTKLVDFGIRSVHLVYELMDGYDVLVLVDTVAQQDGPPGSLYVIEPDLAAITAGDPPPLDPHDLPPGGVLALLPSLGGHGRPGAGRGLHPRAPRGRHRALGDGRGCPGHRGLDGAGRRAA